MALTIPNRFTTGTTIEAGKFNANFDAISTWATATDASVAAAVATIASGKGAYFAHSAATQTLNADTITRLTLGTEVIDTESWGVSGVYTPQVAGHYLMFGSVHAYISGTFTNSNNVVSLFLRKNAATPNHRAASMFAGSSLSYVTVFAANGTTDYFDLAAHQSGTGTMDFFYASFGGMYIGPL